MRPAKALDIPSEEIAQLQSLIKTRTEQAQIVDRARMLVYKSQGNSYSAIAERLDVDVNTVKLCVKKYLAGGLDNALHDAPRSGRPNEITDEDIAWVCRVACLRPADLNKPNELWTLTSLKEYINENAEKAGFPRLKTLGRTTLYQILKRAELKPWKIRYYCEKLDPQFEEKMHDVLVVYKQIELQLDKDGNLVVPDGNPDEEPVIHTVSADEKPGIQAIANTGDDLRPKQGNGCVKRDANYKRLGTLSLLAALDLTTGHVVPVVSETHKSADFICLLKKLNEIYPEGDIIRVVCDNHRIHTSKETRRYLDSLPDGRFIFVFTPKHGSWLNMIEVFFSKMTKQMLKGIRVKSKSELADRIYMYMDEVNANPKPHRWHYKMDEITEEEALAKWPIIS